jgi:hypothetical protein
MCVCVASGQHVAPHQAPRRKEELDKGYWGDANELLKNREGKFFFAVPKLTPKKEAIKLLDAIPASLPTYKPFDFSKVNIEEVRKRTPRHARARALPLPQRVS